MTATDQIREWFHDGVVLNHADRGTAGYEPVCDHSSSNLMVQLVSFPREGGGVFVEPVHLDAAPAFLAYALWMVADGETLGSAGGVNSCRNIAGKDWPSLHAYLCAIDNLRKTPAFQTHILGLRTVSGAQVFRNLPGDQMHDQIDCSPIDLATGIDPATLPGGTPMPTYKNVKNVPDKQWARDIIDRHIDRGIIVNDDDFEDVWNRMAMTDGRFWIFLDRLLGPLEQRIGDIETTLNEMVTVPGPGPAMPEHGHLVTFSATTGPPEPLGVVEGADDV